MIKTIFFDFDGVLTTDGKRSALTCKNIQAVVSDVSYEKILQCYRVSHQPILIGEVRHIDTWNDFCACIERPLDIEVLYDAFRDTPKNDQMFRLAEELRKNYTLGIITDNGADRFDLLTKEMGLDKIFHNIIVSAHVGSTKHGSEIFQKALESVKCRPEECVFIDNDESNLVIPSEMGFHTFWHDHEKNDFTPLIQQLQKWGVFSFS